MKYIQDYPRPQFVRTPWENLNGIWDFAFDDEDRGRADKWFETFPEGTQIRVPFTYETAMSGIGDERQHPAVWYSRRFVPQAGTGRRVRVHFEGSDYSTEVWINGRFAGSHSGGYTRFGFDVTELLRDGENTLTVRVSDSCDMMQPRGKQRWMKDNFSCWYVQTTGIWKTVWLEYVPELNLQKVKMTPLFMENALDLEWSVSAPGYPAGLKLAAEISFDGTPVTRAEFSVTEARGRARLNVFSRDVYEWGVKTWSPQHPNLYDIRFELTLDGAVTDAVDSYFGMREIRIDKGNILLNGMPVYQRLVLDQGYWRDSGLTPPDGQALSDDIDVMMKLGFNGARKHQKIEDERFAYWCDVKGFLMWCEMPSAYDYGDDAVRMLTAEWLDVVEQHYNHPSVIVWTPFNESWGVFQIQTNRMQQHFTESVYHLTKSLDPMRPVIANDGWEHTVSDILSLHDYEESGDVFYERYSRFSTEILNGEVYHCRIKSAMAGEYAYAGQPVIVSEYGGAAFCGGADGDWGYGGAVRDEAQFLRRVRDMTDAIRKLPYVCGFCYTQLTDVQQEINGLLTIDRKFKADPEAIRGIFESTGP